LAKPYKFSKVIESSYFLKSGMCTLEENNELKMAYSSK